jgi:hypothetical protein
MKGTNFNMLKIRVVSVGRGTQSHVLASCKVVLTSEDGTDTVSVLDARVLRNRSGELWVGYHNQSLPRDDGSHQYVPTIEFSKELARRISDAVLEAYGNGGRISQNRMEAYGR